MGESVELARALTGEELPVPEGDIGSIVAELAALGWDAERLALVRRRRMEAREPWPFPIQVEALRQFGFARFDARLAELRAALGLSGQLGVAPAPARGLDRDEQRLAADRPPHWG